MTSSWIVANMRILPAGIAPANLLRVVRAVAFGLAMLAATPSKANVLADDDVIRLAEFDRKSYTTLNDIIAAQRAAQAALGSSPLTYGCLVSLLTSFEFTKSLLLGVVSLASLDTVMVNAADERAVLDQLAEHLRRLLEAIAIQRPHINETMGLCPHVGVVAAKAQEILQLYAELDRVVQAINAKIRFRANRPR
jgi:hypothetical protein